MSRCRYEFSGELEVLSSLHVGSGETRQVATLKAKAVDENGERVLPELDCIARDFARQPYIPATTIKGVLRATAERRVTEDACEQRWIAQLFGMPKRAPDLADGQRDALTASFGNQGAVLFRGATLVVPATDANELPMQADLMNSEPAYLLLPARR